MGSLLFPRSYCGGCCWPYDEEEVVVLLMPAWLGFSDAGGDEESEPVENEGFWRN